jgi:hypothetical protein
MNIDSPLEPLSSQEEAQLLTMAEENLLSAAYGFLNKKMYLTSLKLNLKALSMNFSMNALSLFLKSLIRALLRK